MLRLTSLAPDIVEAILHGDEPDGINLEKLRRDLPVRWHERWVRWADNKRDNQLSLSSFLGFARDRNLHYAAVARRFGRRVPKRTRRPGQATRLLKT